MTPDITNRADLDQLIEIVYGRVFADELIGPFFTQVARVMPETHSPLLADFWETVLFGKNLYHHNIIQRHVELHLKQAIEPHHFERWLSLFCQVVDELFSGPLAEQAKIRAQSMATVLQVKIHTLNHGQTVNNLMQKQSLPPHQKDGTSCSKTVTLADLSGKKVICKTFIPGDTMAPHSAPVDVFALLLDGQMDISLGDETNRFVAGDYIVFPASMTHALACVETARLLIYK